MMLNDTRLLKLFCIIFLHEYMSKGAWVCVKVSWKTSKDDANHLIWYVDDMMKIMACKFNRYEC